MLAIDNMNVMTWGSHKPLHVLNFEKHESFKRVLLPGSILRVADKGPLAS